MDPIHIIITDQPLGMTGYGAVVVSPEMAFAAIVFIAVICSYVGYKALIWKRCSLAGRKLQGGMRNGTQ